MEAALRGSPPLLGAGRGGSPFILSAFLSDSKILWRFERYKMTTSLFGRHKRKYVFLWVRGLKSDEKVMILMMAVIFFSLLTERHIHSDRRTPQMFSRMMNDRSVRSVPSTGKNVFSGSDAVSANFP